MGRPTKRTQHCRELARKPADSLYMYNTITDNAFNDNCYFTDDVIEDESSEFEVYEWNDNRLDDEAEDLYKVLIQNMSNLPTSSRYTKKSRTTQYRYRINAEKSAQENGQTLLDFFDYAPPTNINMIKRKSCDGEFFKRIISDIDSIIRSDRNVSPGQRLRTEAVKHYLQLQQHGWSKIEASLLVVQLLNRGVWFARCIRSWGSAFIAFGNISKKQTRTAFSYQ